MSEAIKIQSSDMDAHIAAYKESLKNLADSGLRTVFYNFMPVLDWTRTDLAAALPHGGQAMAFDLVDFAAFDPHIFKRAAAAEDDSDSLKDAAQEWFASLSDVARAALSSNIVAGLPGGNERWALDDVRVQLRTYDGITPDNLRQNLIDFLAEVAPVAQELGMRLCCHPDDPPFSLLGLPRVMSSVDDYAGVLAAVDLPSSGATICTGSLGVAQGFDPVEFVDCLGSRIHFAHLRNTLRDRPSDGARVSFHDSEHLGGDTDMCAAVQALVAEETRRKKEGRADWEVPMRPDHGQSILTDLDRPMMPGYPLIGRLRGQAELRGVMQMARRMS